ncbi:MULTISPECIES: CHAP domain-containing protein [unclassified Ruminococcus]|uniref:CHAP domain-containing protein n=1 Tax=unclassified Ruminococcus TaxID=2608920 RepID=UPI00210C4921|nr:MULTISPECIES: CHAP domain-containing protein [unclassified Ruminococcus]
MANIREKFVSAAAGYIGYDCTLFNSYFGAPRGTPWCAEFVSKCASDVGAIGKCIVKTAGAGSIAREGVAKGFGKWLEGHLTVPIPGDIISFCWNGKGSYLAEGQDKYFSDHVSIVEYVKNGLIHTIEGNANGSNTSSTVCRKTHKLYGNTINGYFRPNWSLADKSYKENGDDEMNFKFGDRSDGVLAYKSLILLANKLDILKSKVDKSNSFGDGTQAATLEIQKKFGLQQDKIAGVKTITALRNAVIDALTKVIAKKTDRNAVLTEAASAVNDLKVKA